MYEAVNKELVVQE